MVHKQSNFYGRWLCGLKIVTVISGQEEGEGGMTSFWPDWAWCTPLPSSSHPVQVQRRESGCHARYSSRDDYALILQSLHNWQSSVARCALQSLERLQYWMSGVSCEFDGITAYETPPLQYCNHASDCSVQCAIGSRNWGETPALLFSSV